MNRRDVDTYFKSVKTDLESKLTKASELLAAIEQKLGETESNRQQSANTLNTLTENFNSAISLINQTRDDLTKVTELRTVALDPDSGIETLLTKINTTHEQTEKLVERISTYSQESQTNSEKIKNESKTSSEKLANLEKMSKQAQNLLTDLEKTYQLAINTGLAGSFDKRKKEVEEEFVKSWGKRFTISVIALGVFAALVLIISFLVNGFTLEWLTIFRLALVTPLVFYTGYAAVQYGKERKLLEKYAFKATVAAAIESYTTILHQNFDKTLNEKEILSFVLDSMKTIYKEPHEEVTKRTWGFSFGNKFAEMKSEIVEEVAEEVKKVLDLQKQDGTT